MTADLLSVGALLERAVAFDGDGAARMSTLASFGVGRGARVAVLSDNGLPFLELYFAAAGLGAVLVPLNTRLSPAEVAGVLDQAGPLVLVARPGLATVAREALDRAAAAPTLLWLEGPPEGGPRSGEEVDRLETRDRPDGAFAATPVDPTALAHLYFTSGTTGRPKGVMLTHRNVVTHALHAAVELELSTRDVWAHVAPMFHLADAWATFALTLVRGVHVFLPRFQAVPALDLLEGEGVTLTNLVPTMLADMVADESAAGRAPIAPEVVARIRSTFKTEYVQTYGMTETSPYLTLSRLSRAQQSLDEEERLRLSARTGRPFLGVDLEVVDADGHRVPRDDATVGEIRVRGATVTPGYWNDEDATDTAIREGWLYTGDLATIDAHGF
ncbi:MAG: AMP-binding protein, partial [Planctomycetota bacterium]